MLLSLILSATFASAQATPNREQITLRGTVQAVDATARTITIRGETGNVVTLDVPQSVKRLNEVKVGDVVSAVYYDQVTVTAHPPGAPDADRLEPPIATSTPGALPGGTVAQRRVTTVTITGWDPATRVVTFTVPSGATYGRRLVETTDANLMNGLKVGDRVDVTRTEAVRIGVERAGKRLHADALLHRLTASVLFGWDNQFSGKMIKEATGQTTGGAPINLDETTYDEVYGRIGMFKIGAAYRTTPAHRGRIQLRVVQQFCGGGRRPRSARWADPDGDSPHCRIHLVQVLGHRGGPAVVLRTHPLHALRRLPRGRQPAPGHPWYVRQRAAKSHAGACSAERQVLRKVVGDQLGSDRLACSSA